MITQRYHQQALAIGSPCVIALIGCAVIELALRIVHHVYPFRR